MGYAMAKVVAVLCVALLVAHVDSARTLKEVTGKMMTAETFASVETLPPPVVKDSKFETVPSPDSPEEYNYNKDSHTGAEFASEGFLLPSSPSDIPDSGTEEYGNEDAVLAEEKPVAVEDAPWKPIDVDRVDASTDSFADETNGSFLVDSPGTDDPKPYEYDATTRDAQAVYPDGGNPDSFADSYVMDSSPQEVNSSEFEFDDSKEFGN